MLHPLFFFEIEIMPWMLLWSWVPQLRLYVCGFGPQAKWFMSGFCFELGCPGFRLLLESQSSSHLFCVDVQCLGCALWDELNAPTTLQGSSTLQPNTLALGFACTCHVPAIDVVVWKFNAFTSHPLKTDCSGPGFNGHAASLEAGTWSRCAPLGHSMGEPVRKELEFLSHTTRGDSLDICCEQLWNGVDGDQQYKICPFH